MLHYSEFCDKVGKKTKIHCLRSMFISIMKIKEWEWEWDNDNINELNTVIRTYIIFDRLHTHTHTHLYLRHQTNICPNCPYFYLLAPREHPTQLWRHRRHCEGKEADNHGQHHTP